MATNKKELIKKYRDELEKLGYNNSLLIACDDARAILSSINVENINYALSLIGMLIKVLSEELEMKSDELAKELLEKLSYAEKKMEEREKEKNTIHINIM